MPLFRRQSRVETPVQAVAIENSTPDVIDEGLEKTRAHLAARYAELIAAGAPSPFVNYFAPIWPPSDPDIFSADWRDQLHPDDPYRTMGPPRVEHGSPEIAETFSIMHAALLKSMAEE